MIRGSVAGSVPYLVFGVMKKHDRPMGAGEVFRQFAPELKVTRISVGTALHELCNKKIAAKNGRRGSMLYSLTGIPLPQRVPVKKYWKSKPSKAAAPQQYPETSFNFKNKNPLDALTEQGLIALVAPSKTAKAPTLRTPELILCNPCFWYGQEVGCEDCRYE